MENLPTLVQAKIFNLLDTKTLKVLRFVCSSWNQDILDWAGLDVYVDELDDENLEFMRKLGCVGQAMVVSILPGSEGNAQHLIKHAVLKTRVNANILKGIFTMQRLRSLHIMEDFLNQSFGIITKSWELSPLISHTLKELRLSLPFLGRPPVKLTSMLNENVSSLLKNISCPNLRLLEIQESISNKYHLREKSYSIGFQRLSWSKQCWDCDSIRIFLAKHSNSLKNLKLSPVRNFSSELNIEYPAKLQVLDLDVTTHYPENGHNYWENLIRVQTDLQEIRLDFKQLNFPSTNDNYYYSWPFSQMQVSHLKHISLSCSGCRISPNQLLLDCQAFGVCSNLESLRVTRNFAEHDFGRRIMDFPFVTGLEFLPISLKFFRLYNVSVSSEEFRHLRRLQLIEKIHWRNYPAIISFVDVDLETLKDLFHLRQLNSLCFPISNSSYDQLLNHRPICNIFHGAETSFGTGLIDFPELCV